MKMLNLYESARTNPHFHTLEIGDFLFAKYTCPIRDEKVGIWADTDYLVHVISGKKVWHTTDAVWEAKAGETLFFKKGAAIIEQFFYEDFCVLLFFIPDHFVKNVVSELVPDLGAGATAVDAAVSAIRVQPDVGLTAYYQSMLTYFSGVAKPSEHLLRLKLRELIVGILVSQNNLELASYFQVQAQSGVPLLPEVMEANFRYNLSLEEFARLCHRSLSSFKRDFRKHYNKPPGRWLLNKRLDFAATLLRNADLNITQVTFCCVRSRFQVVMKAAPRFCL